MLLKEKILDVFFKNASLINKNKEELEMHWDESLQLLNPEQKEILLLQYKYFMPKTTKELILFLYFLFSGCFYLLILYNKKKYFEFGLKTNLLENALLKKNMFEWKKIQIFAIYPYKSEAIILEIFAKEFFPLIRRFILNDAQILYSNSYDYLENTIHFVEKRSKPYLQKNIPVTLSHFKFENLENYIYYLRNLGIYNFVLDLENFIHSKLKKRDLLVILSYNSFLVMSIGAKKEQIYERFKSVYIEIYNLVLDYHFYIETLYTVNDSVREVFFKLKI